jgi:hypothetical protein
VTVQKRGQRMLMRRPVGAPPMAHIPRGRPPGVPNPPKLGDKLVLGSYAKGSRVRLAKRYGDQHQHLEAGDWVTVVLNNAAGAGYVVVKNERNGATHELDGRSPLFEVDSSARKNPEETFDTDILAGMERAIWVTSYADWVENMTKAERKAAGTPVNLDGVDWSRDAPPAPASAQMAAQDLYLAYERANGSKTPGQLYELAVHADGASATDELADTFGHYLAMMALDTGVSWFDDHAQFPLKEASFEAHCDDGEVIWSPRIRSTLNPGERR